ncbi:PKD domain-containing protein [archaeon]|nr:PKD domain-containing protein [archaeon]
MQKFWIVLGAALLVASIGLASQPPTVNIVQLNACAEGEPCNFSADASDADGNITAYYWDFGDNNTAAGENATHIYNASGNYTIVLTATDNDSDQGNDTLVVVVSEPAPFNNPPVVDAGPNKNGTVGQNLTFYALAVDADNDTLNFTWYFGDNTYATTNPAVHSYGGTGTYIVTLLVSDGRSNTTETLTVNISAQPNIPTQDQNNQSQPERERSIERIESVVVDPLIVRIGQKVNITIIATFPKVNVTVAGTTYTLTDYNEDHRFTYELTAPGEDGKYTITVTPALEGGDAKAAQLEVDSIPPQITSTGITNSTRQRNEILISTNENSECRFSSQDVTLDRMNLFDSTRGKTHSTAVNLGEGENRFYVLCRDAAGNVPSTPEQLTIRFSPSSSSSGTSATGFASARAANPLAAAAVLAAAGAVAVTAMLLYRKHL